MINHASCSITDWQQHLDDLFGKRNSIFIESTARAVNILTWKVSDLSDRIRHNKVEEYPLALASLFAWFMGLINRYSGMPLEKAMWQKYGRSLCPYCQKFPCLGCGENRPDPILNPAIEISWRRLSEWQAHLAAIYQTKNSQAGVGLAISRLHAEISEVVELQEGLCRVGTSLAEVEELLSLELADVLAWILGLASQLGVELEPVLLAHYSRCRSCERGNGCDCGAVIFDSGRLRRTRSVLVDRRDLPRTEPAPVGG